MMSTMQKMMEESGMTAEQMMAMMAKMQAGTTDATKVQVSHDGNVTVTETEAEVAETKEPEAAAAPVEDTETTETKKNNDISAYNKDKCIARCWAGGIGDQCSRKPMSGSEYCKMHAKRAEICSEGGVDKKGLWLGRIDKPKPTTAPDGTVVIEWADPDKHDEIRAKKAQKKNAPKAEKKKKEKKQKRSPSAYALFLKQSQDAIKAAAGEDADFSTRQKKASDMWKNMSEEDKKPFVEQSQELKKAFNEKKDKEEASKGPKKPKRSPSAYLCYASSVRAGLRDENPGLKMTDITKMIGTAWKALSDEEKKPFVTEAAEKRKIYDAQMEAYKALLPKEQPPAELFDEISEEKEVTTDAYKADTVEESDDESDDEELDLKAFTCNVSPYKGEILGLDISTKTVYKVDGDEGTVVGKVEDFKLNEEGKLDEDSIVGLVIDDE